MIDHTHGRRATDNLKDLKPELAGTPDKDMAPHVQEFETKILDAADEYHKEVRSRRQSMAEEIVSQATLSGWPFNAKRATRVLGLLTSQSLSSSFRCSSIAD